VAIRRNCFLSVLLPVAESPGNWSPLFRPDGPVVTGYPRIAAAAWTGALRARSRPRCRRRAWSCGRRPGVPHAHFARRQSAVGWNWPAGTRTRWASLPQAAAWSLCRDLPCGPVAAGERPQLLVIFTCHSRAFTPCRRAAPFSFPAPSRRAAPEGTCAAARDHAGQALGAPVCARSALFVMDGAVAVPDRIVRAHASVSPSHVLASAVLALCKELVT
jgi:hypothetical protein